MKSPISNQRGQFVIEAVLLMIVLVGIFVASMNSLREGKYLSKLISGPWESIAGMIESGVWEPASTARKKHPNQFNRNVSIDPSKL